ncbi:MAG: preprotein translocase subunit YajC [Clostridia bacterium]|nr:preprotein translocase subunit YajC [Clostridia bacterium]
MLSFFDPTILASLVSCGGADSGSSGSSGAAPAGGFGGWTLIIMLVLMVVLFLVMSIPQRKREKKVKEMLDSLKPGDRVRTIGGMYGTVTSIKDDVVTLSVGPDKARLVFARGAIATIEDAPVEATIDGDVKDVK